MKSLYKTQQGRPLFTMGILARYKNITTTFSESYEHELRTCPSCIKKGVFNVQEGHVLERRRACSCSKLGLSSKREGHDN